MMEWAEVNCLISALEALVEKCHVLQRSAELDDDDRADLSNDMAYAEILLGKYREERTRLLGQ